MDLTNILKHAPKGFVLYSTVHGEVKFQCVSKDNDNKDYPIIVYKYYSSYSIDY